MICASLFQKRNVASFIGTVTSKFKQMNLDHGIIETFCKDNSLKVNKGNFNARMRLTGNIWNVKIDKAIHTNASLGSFS